MQKIKIADITLRENDNSMGTGYSFKEKIEIAKKLDKLNVDIIETAKISNSKTDILFLHTIAPLLQNSIISCPVEYSEEAIETTAAALKDAKVIYFNGRGNVTSLLEVMERELQNFCE